MEAEREAVAMYRAYLMRDQIGERFDGTVSAVTSFGAFVEIESPYVEGLIKLESLGDEPFSYDQIHMRLSGRRTGKSIELGDKVTVEINNVSQSSAGASTSRSSTAATVREVPKLEPSGRASVKQKKKVGHAIDKAGKPQARGHVMRGGKGRELRLPACSRTAACGCPSASCRGLRTPRSACARTSRHRCTGSARRASPARARADRALVKREIVQAIDERRPRQLVGGTPSA